MGGTMKTFLIVVAIILGSIVLLGGCIATAWFIADKLRDKRYEDWKRYYDYTQQSAVVLVYDVEIETR